MNFKVIYLKNLIHLIKCWVLMIKMNPSKFKTFFKQCNSPIRFLTNIELMSTFKLQNPLVKKLKLNCNITKQGLTYLKSRLVFVLMDPPITSNSNSKVVVAGR